LDFSDGRPGDLQLPDSYTLSPVFKISKLTDILKILPRTPLIELQKLHEAIESEIKHRESLDLVDYIPDFCEQQDIKAVLDECLSMGLPSDTRKASSQWLSPINEPYVYSDSNPVHKAKDINEFPAICKVLDKINTDGRFQGKLDSCLVLKYSCEGTSVSLHADDEDSLDQSKSICNFSIGATRTLEFFSHDGKKAVKSVLMESGSITHMKPGTQSVLKHMVRGKSTRLPELRYSLSFRALAKGNISPVPPQFSPVSPQPQQRAPNVTPQFSPVSPHPQHRAANVSASAVPSLQQPPKRICLIAGDSYAARLDVARLGRNKLNVINIAKGGAKIGHVVQQLERFSEDNPDVVVDKLLLSVGTNNLRNCYNGVGHLRGHLKLLFGKVHTLFPMARVYFQSLIPLPCRSSDWVTNQNIMDFNGILINECIFRKYYMLDAFGSFSKVCDGRNPNIRRERFFEGNDIHPSAKRGMGVLASLYLRALHSRFFNPFVLQ
jgi:alkylated DNA repair dioxygenase AlkB